jgi:hypothetical protein
MESPKIAPTVSCPHCRQPLVRNPTLAGKEVMCPSCRGVFQMPVPVASIVPATVLAPYAQLVPSQRESERVSPQGELNLLRREGGDQDDSNDKAGTVCDTPSDPAGERRPWNPVVIAWLGLLFSPVWSGTMAALNGHRLGLRLPLWRPLGIGVGALLLSFGQSFVLGWYVLDLVLYLGAAQK